MKKQLLLLAALLPVLMFGQTMDEIKGEIVKEQDGIRYFVENDTLKARRLDAPSRKKMNGSVFESVDVMPEFPGGVNALAKWLGENIRYPESTRESCIQGRIIVECVIEKDGKIYEAKIIKSLHPVLDEEALRLALSMPKWKSGKHKNKRVRVACKIPIIFKLV